jgi:hypothetical protein
LVTFAASSGTGNATTTQSGTAPGIGNAVAETVKVDPRAGGLSLGITAARAIAGHQNSVAQASSQALDLGIIGTTLAAQGCDGSAPTLAAEKQPQPLQVDSRQQGASEFTTVSEQNGAFVKQARATADPFGEAITRSAPFGVPGAIEVGAGTAHTTSGLVNGVRIATASVDISGMKLAGQIELAGLHWEVSYPSTGDAQPSGTFSVGSLKVAGVPVPAQDPISTLASLNAVLNALGIDVQPPSFHVLQGIGYVDPLRISIVPNATRDQVFGSLLRGAQPIRQPLIEALLKAKCSLASEITVFDVALGSVSGAGAFNLLLGGVQATTGEAPVNSYTLGGQNLIGGNSAPLSTGTLAGGGLTNTAPRPSTTPSVPTQMAAPAPSSTQQVAAAKTKGERGGALAGVGLAGLLLLAAVAEGDRRKMRQAQRAITFDD